MRLGGQAQQEWTIENPTALGGFIQGRSVDQYSMDLMRPKKIVNDSVEESITVIYEIVKDDGASIDLSLIHI